MSRLAALIFVIASTAALAVSQTTIFNIPTADTLPRGSWNLEGDFLTKPVSYDKGGFQAYGYRVAYGLDNKNEVGANFYLTYDGTRSVAQSEFSYKRTLYRSEKHGISTSGGAVLFVPLRNKDGERVAGVIYGNASKSIEPLNGMRLTGGAYHVLRGSKDFGTRTGAMAGIVQPVAGRVSFVADWFSGNNRLGYSSAGLNFNITKRQYLLSGYSFGNSGRGNNLLAVYYGMTF